MTDYDIKNLSEYFEEIHYRYYIDNNGNVYTSLSANTHKIMIDGRRISVKSFKNKMLPLLNDTNAKICQYKDTNYFLMFDGTFLKRLKLNSTNSDEVFVSLIRQKGGNDRGNHYFVSRLLAGVFLGNINEKEVHHLDGNRRNNNLSNLKIMTFEEHRSKGQFKKNHSRQFSND